MTEQELKEEFLKKNPRIAAKQGMFYFDNKNMIDCAVCKGSKVIQGKTSLAEESSAVQCPSCSGIGKTWG